MLKKCLIRICPRHSIDATIEDNAIDIIYVEEPGIHTVSTDRCATIVRGPGRSLLFCFEKNFLNIDKNLGKSYLTRRQEKEKP